MQFYHLSRRPLEPGPPCWLECQRKMIMLVGAPADQGRAGRRTSARWPKASIQVMAEGLGPSAHAGLIQQTKRTRGCNPPNRVASKVGRKPTNAWRSGGAEPQHLAKAGPTRRTWRRSGTGRTAKGPKARAKKHRGKAPVTLISLTREVRLAPTREVGLKGWFLTREVRLALTREVRLESTK